MPPSGPELGERVVLGPMLPWLPVPATALVGRESDVALIGELLQPANGRERPLTLVGPGGVGKTRLALAVAAVVGPSFQDGAVFVHLASLRDPRLVPATIARALALREAAGRSIEDALSEHLRDRQMLLVLDNFEHLSGAAWLLAEMIQACPRLARLEREHGNVRAALQWALNTGQLDQGLRLAGANWHFWWVRGQLREGLRWLDELLQRSVDTTVAPVSVSVSVRVRAKGLNAAGGLAFGQGDYERARTLDGTYRVTDTGHLRVRSFGPSTTTGS